MNEEVIEERKLNKDVANKIAEIWSEVVVPTKTTRSPKGWKLFILGKFVECFGTVRHQTVFRCQKCQKDIVKNAPELWTHQKISETPMQKYPKRYLLCAECPDCDSELRLEITKQKFEQYQRRNNITKNA